MAENAYLRKSAIGIALVCAITGGTVATATAAFAAPAPAPAASATATPAADNDKGGAGQGPRTPAHPRSSLVAGATKLAPKITRSEAIKRAKSWVGIGLSYNQGGSYKGYRTDCSGYVSMAWNLSDSLATPEFGPEGVTEKISKNELKAGDALLNPKPGNYGHIVLFEKWANSDHSAYWGYEFTGSGVHYREIPYTYFSGYDAGSYYPVRNKSVVDDGPSDPGMTQLTAGDLNADGKKDVVAVKVETGELFLYPGTGKSGLDMLGDRVEIGSGGWNGMKNLTVGDFNGDGKDDLVASKTETGELFLYPGTGKKSLEALGDRVLIGTGGWNGMNNLSAGDFNGDGKADIIASKNETGELFLYPGTANKGLDTLGSRTLIGTGGWNGMNKLAAGDFNKDGKPDLVATKT
ncbi:FG-GAP-like repeat-containing protein, partial [Streptomyces cinnamoneus]